ncbi:Molybdopterin oxidoreductase, iron-sulfur binding subunit [Fulvivirga imtechensis AK7]|uniref:Molybdopterin oxidoreductase, iron-sulfur binding subunit n=1 Tax=Fulvivirga imtechensis AK7 TaxID=1237149 RepID=L8JTJ5_9BACT|nr:TAT-variant-translocated molybdopterin oxidoreductase [Fulvivirga imtechensis]ELR70829.1 Molybdopterin oxidoreductase, iron-sulfur binding subunit [Fulvivirga imtechensis AK7]
MNDNKKTYWKGIEQLSNDPEFVKNADREFPEFLPINGNSEGGGSSRRDFLKMMGFGIAAVSLAACEAPVRKAIPYVNKPVDVDPGIPNYYASTYTHGGDYCSILVKTREGRPIKIEGNSLCKITEGGTSAQVQASVLTLYDRERLGLPVIGGKDGTWEDLDKEVIAKLRSIAAQGGQIRIVSNTVLSPTTKQVIEDFKAQYPTAQHVVYDAVSAHGILAANEESFGTRAIPRYDFSRADVIVSFAADFLGTWLSPVEYSRQYSKTRKIGANKKTMSRHYQFESLLSMTGGNADYRTRIKPSEEGKAVVALYEAITANKKSDIEYINKAAADLKKAQGKSLVVAGSNDPRVQVVVNAINSALNNYGTTIDLSSPAYYKQGDDAAMDRFVNDVKGGKVAGVIFYNCNPVYNYKGGAELAEALKKVSLKVSTSDRPDETAAISDYVAPDHHFLESWGDAEPVQGYYTFVQPAITPIFNTRQAQESLLTWAGVQTPDYYTYLKNAWARRGVSGNAWDKALHDGILGARSASAGVEGDTTSLASTVTAAAGAAAFAGDVSKASAAINNIKGSGLELVIYQKVAIGDGSQANNPWLQEMPDPVTKATWDNYLSVSPKWASENDVKSFEGKCNMARITVNGVSKDVPVLIQPGQAEGTVGLALGYGRVNGGLVANGRGVDAYPFMQVQNGVVAYQVLSGVQVEVLSEVYQIAQTQTHQTYMGRDTVVQESVLSKYQDDPFAGRHDPKIATWMSEEGSVHPGALSLWKGHKYNNHHWGMAIDLNSCTGCSACTIACQAENNVPVVGRDEVINRRDMHWLRIDRYYSSDADPEDKRGLEIAAANPEVTFQPMLCQHCNNAPCETVCPVAATTHSTEGLNQMTYNRCIGTRYCANNCPYKVRRFNWFKYHDNGNFEDINTPMNNDLGKMVLNPDVTVRSRGVMEKCSFCVQRIQYGKLEAKKEGRRPKDGDITTACASACPTDAIVFGDMNDTESRIYKMLNINDTDGPDYITEKEILEPRAYHVIGEIGTKPNVTYLTKIRNKDIEETKA